MCLPAAVVGIITAVTSVVGSIAAYSQQQQEAAYQNAVAQQQYQASLQQTEYQNLVNRQQYQAQMQLFERSVQITEDQYRLNAEAANRGYVSEQNRLRIEYQKTAQEQQKLLVSSLQAQGTILASGRTGQSIGLLASDADRQYNRDLATLGFNLATARNDFFEATQSIYTQAQNANNMAASNRMLEPTQPMNLPQPIAPPRIPGPSGLGLATGIAGGLMGGYGTYQSLKAPSANVPTANSRPTGSSGSSQYQPGTPAIYNPPSLRAPNYSGAFQTVPRASRVR